MFTIRDNRTKNVSSMCFYAVNVSPLKGKGIKVNVDLYSALKVTVYIAVKT